MRGVASHELCYRVSVATKVGSLTVVGAGAHVSVP
jgi:hypothetical protein